MPTPFFADLVRELCHEGGTGPLTPAGPVPGHRAFAGTVPAETAFHYAIAGIARPDEWETGTGRIGGDGRLLRDSVAASSNGGAAVAFAPGLKTIALTAGAAWYAERGTAEAALAASLAAKQPLSTGHETAAAGAAGDTLTVRRGGGWVNVPIAALAYQDASGMIVAGAPVGAPAGTASAPSLSFTGDSNTGFFRPAADTVALATGGGERVRITPAGNVGIGTNAPGKLLELSSADQSNARMRITNSSAARSYDLVAGIQNVGQTGFSVFDVAAGLTRIVLDTSGAVRPGADNGQTLGAASFRWSVMYAATGTINTSDAREKAWRGPADAAELRAASRIADELGFFRWSEAIARKGAGARLHFGVRAQAVWRIMAEEGLIDPVGADGRPGATPYAFLCFDETADAAGRFGVRSDQLALFLIAGLAGRLAATEAAA